MTTARRKLRETKPKTKTFTGYVRGFCYEEWHILIEVAPWQLLDLPGTKSEV
ncbi:hypothetical protein HRR90_001758 [Exophiala dermatitidis]|nr:hypothetical protein HRR74_002921 [Exophiala dermatitidis]KAJ4529662.1 hypothetical protein HRR73_000689 [Exophiala dermatitidis]KAJ4583037.1 hypothetical protein HRR81_001771 [Exophiala dermatitidis]KAJ4659402.1 hypothetical protein HRR90_001758 [Exophiala dermatitidis]KAJ4681016.1 hypothetical protein HRR93_002310 [Exophiala dermatitidis]